MDNDIELLNSTLVASMFRFRKIASSLIAGVDSEMKDLNLNMTEFTLIKEIENNSIQSQENIHISDIQNILFISKPAISQMLNALEKKGYINRTVDKKNRRKLIITLTTEGQTAKKAVEEKVSGKLNKIISGLGKENAEQLIKTINRLEKVIGQIVNEEDVPK